MFLVVSAGVPVLGLGKAAETDVACTTAFLWGGQFW